MALALAAAVLAGATGAAAEPVLVADGTTRSLADLRTGEQIVLERQSGPLAFAGRTLALDDCVAVVGFASEAAFLMVLAGQARSGDLLARPGEMLLLSPFGGRVMVERFDAGRFRTGLAPAAAAAAPAATAALDRLARAQARGVFLGRYQRTLFNVGVSGLASAEIGRRRMIGGATVRAIRFGGTARDVPERVVARFATALRQRDAGTAAELLDPIAFGGEAMGVAGDAARASYARALVAERDWGRQLDGAAPARGPDDRRWTLAGPAGATAVTLRVTPDFAFVQAVSTESK